MKLEIIVTERAGTVIAALSGSINAANAEEVLDTLAPLAAGGGRLLLEASALDYVSSAGLRLLLQLHRTAATSGGQVIVAGLNPQITEVMLVTGFLRHFTRVQTLAEAFDG
jgi:anti-anti-sigma factor